MVRQTYLIALGGNVFGPWGRPEALLRTIAADMSGVSRVVLSRPLGPSRRSYANAVAILENDAAPPAMLATLKACERRHGRRAGRRWGARTLDLDIIGWSGGIWASSGLSIPHPAFRKRRFVLSPLAEIAPGWRDPLTGLSTRHLLARLDRRRPRE